MRHFMLERHLTPRGHTALLLSAGHSITVCGSSLRALCVCRGKLRVRPCRSVLPFLKSSLSVTFDHVWGQACPVGFAPGAWSPVCSEGDVSGLRNN